MTKRIKILFIMFQGDHSNLKSWNEYTESKFLDRLKKIGSVYTYQDKTYNIWHYDKTHPEYKDYDPDILSFAANFYLIILLLNSSD